MTKRSFLLCAGIALALAAILAAAPDDSHSKPDSSTEAARLNNLGAAYMNQQLFREGPQGVSGGLRHPRSQTADRVA
jgi:hypothetical protein